MATGANAFREGEVAAIGTTPRIPWGTMLWFGALLIALFAQPIYSMASEWLNNEDMGHGLFAPFIAAYAAWLDRHRILATRLNPTWFGLAVVVLGFLSMIAGVRGADFFVARMGFIFGFLGVLLTLGGTNLIKRLWFPLLIMMFMIRIPDFLYSRITFPLQLLASNVAEKLLTLIGIPVLRDGNILELASQRLSVVEACSGIRSLMSLALLSLVYGHFFDPKSWMRWVLLALSVPIAITVNALRVTLTGIVSEIDKDLAAGTFHSIEGLLMWAMALGSLVAAHQIVNRSYQRWAVAPPSGSSNNTSGDGSSK